jgi:transketolase
MTVVGIASGFEMEYFGNSHYGYDDIACMRSISRLTILCPADTTELVKMLDELMERDMPVYLRLTKMSRKAVVYKNDFDYRIGKANILKPLGNVTIIATGSITSIALEVAERLEDEKKIKCGVVDMHTIKPLDEEVIRAACEKGSLIVTLEEHNIIGGLGSAVAEVCASYKQCAELLAIGVPDVHTHVGDYNFMLKSYGLDAESVFERIVEKLSVQY